MQGQAGPLDDGLYVFQHLPGLGFDVACDQFAGFRIQRNLSGDKQQIPELDGLGVRAYGGRGFVGRNNFFDLIFLRLFSIYKTLPLRGTV